MKKNNKRLMFYSVLGMMFFSTTVLASGSKNTLGKLESSLIQEAFTTIFFCAFFLAPFSSLVTKDQKSKDKIFASVFGVRVAILLLGNYFTVNMPIYDLIFTGICIVIILPITVIFSKKEKIVAALSKINNTTKPTICPNCHKELTSESKFCASCGTPIIENNLNEQNTFAASSNNPPTIKIANKIKCPKCGYEMTVGNSRCPKCGESVKSVNVTYSELEVFDANKGTPIQSNSYDNYLTVANETKSLKEIIKKELENIENSKNITLPIVEKKKSILTIVYAAILFIITTIFFLYHSSDLNFINYIGIAITIIYIIIYKNYNILSHLAKELKSRPDEKINYIVSSTLTGSINTATRNNILRLTLIICVIIIQLGIYWEPHMIFEKYNEGYAVRYYTYGIVKKDKNLTVPSHYKGKQVISIRGDVFENSKSLVTVTLPETLQEIRGGAFKNCSSLQTINLPSKITEIRGNTFEGCTNLQKITIPSGVTRIGGSAFRDCLNLAEVTIPETVREIGSSAFRNTALKKVCYSNRASVNERAFKGTYANITYHENGCENTYGNYDNFNGGY